MTDAVRRLFAAALVWSATASVALAQTPPEPAAAAAEKHEAEAVGDWPRVSFDTLASLEYAGMRAASGTSRGPGLSLRFDSTGLIEFNDMLSLDGLFQFKPREPRPRSDP